MRPKAHLKNIGTISAKINTKANHGIGCLLGRSALLKLYAPEQDSDQYRRLLITQHKQVAISALHDVEFYYALRCKEARGAISTGASHQLIESFHQHVREGRHFQIPWGQDLVQQACDALDRCITGTPPRPLRSLDGLHLGALLAANIQSIVTADVRRQRRRWGYRISFPYPNRTLTGCLFT